MITRFPTVERIRALGRLSDLFDEFFPGFEELKADWAPTAGVKETDCDITFFVDVHGMKREDIEVEFVGDVLTVRGKRELSKEKKADEYVRVERSYVSFQRSFTVGFPVEVHRVKATYKDGVLRVVLPNAEETRPHRIAVTVGD
ncbi:MAG: Hsp20/alpha crystallin family protein [Armatimonadetes bacterium]|nr:Hsp20/alpha crystallin family protein [Armatimonadota bacterium]